MSFETASFGRDDNETTDKGQVETGGEDDHINPEQEGSLERFDPEELKEAMDAGKVEILERSAAEIAEIEQDIAAVEADEAATQEQKESTIFSLNQLKETVKQVASQYGHRLKHYGLISLVLFSGFSKVKPPERFQPAGPEEPLTAWNHEDYQTQNILNVVAGDGIPENPTKVDLLRKELSGYLLNQPDVSNDQVGDIASNVGNRSYDGLVDLALKEGLIDSRSESDIDNFITESFTFQSHKERAESEYREYRAIWEMHKEYGNPKIRIDTSTDRAYYTPDTNTMYITSDAPLKGEDMSVEEFNKVIEDWVAELSHAKQFTGEGKEKAFKQHDRDKQIAEKYADRHGVPYSDARDSTLYHKPGTIEHEAHQEIEPELEDEFEERAYGNINEVGQETNSQNQANS